MIFFSHVYCELFNPSDIRSVLADNHLVPTESFLEVMARRTAPCPRLLSAASKYFPRGLDPDEPLVTGSLVVPRAVKDVNASPTKCVFKLKNFIFSAEIVLGEEVKIHFNFIRRESSTDLDEDIPTELNKNKLKIFIVAVKVDGISRTVQKFDHDLSLADVDGGKSCPIPELQGELGIVFHICCVNNVCMQPTSPSAPRLTLYAHG